MILGLSIALVSALGTNVSALLKARGAGLARPVRIRHPLRSAMNLFRSRWFAIGWLLALVAWGLHVAALCWRHSRACRRSSPADSSSSRCSSR